MNRYRLAIFDLDGTILNTLDDLADSLNTALAACGYPELSAGTVRKIVGNGIRRLVESAVPAACTAEETERVYTVFMETYLRRCCEKTRPYPGIEEAFGRLHAEGVQIAVVSNKADSAVRRICGTYFPGALDYCAGETEQVRKKPAPDMVYAAMEACHVRAEETVYIGDSEVDIRTAESAGLDSVIVTWGFRDRQCLQEQGAVRMADTVQEMLDCIR